MCTKFLPGIILLLIGQAAHAADPVLGCYEDVSFEAVPEVIEFTSRPATGLPGAPSGAKQITWRGGDTANAWKARYWLREGDEVVLVSTNDGIEGFRVTLNITNEGLEGFSTELNPNKGDPHVGPLRVGYQRRVELHYAPCELRRP